MQLTKLENAPLLHGVSKYECWRLENSRGAAVTLCNLGPAITEWLVPDRTGKPRNIMLGYPHLRDYKSDTSYQGFAAIGRCANRIADARYTNPADDVTVRLAPNDGPHHLHGGANGWHRQTWKVSHPKCDSNSASLDFELFDPQAKDGFPGDVRAAVTISLSEDNLLEFHYRAETTALTVINPTFHGYFNLNGADSRSTVKNHFFKSNAGAFLPPDEKLIPTGEVRSVTGTRFDFRAGDILENRFEEAGFDNCLVFPRETRGTAEIFSPATGVFVGMETDRPALQLYTGYFLRAPFVQYEGMCLESQSLVNAVNHPEWSAVYGSPFLSPGELFISRTTYAFGVR